MICICKSPIKNYRIDTHKIYLTTPLGQLTMEILKVNKAMEANMELLIKMTWDPEALVWVAESDDVPGLVMESGSCDALIEKLRFAIPEMLQLNGTSRFR